MTPFSDYMDYPFQNKGFGYGPLSHFFYRQRLIFSMSFVFRSDELSIWKTHSEFDSTTWS
jgi:hypothetical protein